MSETKPDREISWWGEPDQERLTAETMEEAVEDILDRLFSEGNPMPDEIIVAGFCRMECPLSLDDLNRLIEDRDNEYGDPDGDSNEATPAMIEAWNAFAAVFEREYTVFSCEEVTRKHIDVKQWLKDHPPADDDFYKSTDEVLY